MQEKINQLTMLQQNMHSLLTQKQQYQSALFEIESATEELQNVEKGYKIIGNIMVASSKKKLEDDLTKRKEVIDLRLKSLEKQESKLKEKAEELQSEIMKDMKEKEE